MKPALPALLQHIDATIAARRLLRDGARALVAVSGGLDSMVLLEALHKLAARHHWRLIVAHFNHQLRGAASDADERLVARAAKSRGLKFVSARWPREQQGAARRHGLEMAARLARHEFLARAAREHGARVIALAHHADDQVELFFLRLLRGSGGEGLAGMKWSSPSPVDRRLTLVRPLLDLPKPALADHARRGRIQFREDASNLNTRHDRNWLRRNLLPALARRFGAGALASIRRAMELAGDDAAFVQQIAGQWLAERRRTPFEQLPVAVQRQCVRLQLRRMNLPMGFELVEHLRQSGGPVSVTPDAVVRREDSGMIVRRQQQAMGFDCAAVTVKRGTGGKTEFADVQFEWACESRRGRFGKPAPEAGREVFDAARVGSSFTLRHWRPGDRFQPIGMRQAVKLQDLFTNAKISQVRRRALVVAEAARGEIFWVEGLRIGERFKLSARTRQCLRWQWRR